jgi:hypothetical protein
MTTIHRLTLAAVLASLLGPVSAALAHDRPERPGVRETETRIGEDRERRHRRDHRRPNRPDRPDRAERPDRPDRPERPERPRR